MFIEGRFDDIDDLVGNFSPWQLSWHQISPGPLQSTVTMRATQQAVVSRIIVDKTIEQQGQPPPGWFACAITDDETALSSWHGKPSSDNELFLFGMNQEYHSVNTEHFKVWAMWFDGDRLQHFNDTLAIMPATEFERMLGGKSSVTLGQQAGHWLRQQITSFMGADHGSVSEAEDLLAILILELVAKNNQTWPQSRQRHQRHLPNNQHKRYQLLKTATEFITSNPHNTVQSVCSEINISWRSLNYLFQEFYGQTPKYYQTSHRLETFRQAIKSDMQGSDLSALAQHVGLTYNGSLSNQFYRHFGYLPSELKRSQKKNGKSRKGQ